MKDCRCVICGSDTEREVMDYYEDMVPLCHDMFCEKIFKQEIGEN